MVELRVLSGLHRGATLPLDDQPHVIGASEDADVVLVDTGIEEKHATLTLTDTGWLLSALDGSLSTADSNKPQTLIDLAPGDFARLGGVWLTVVDQDARWENPPPEPTDSAEPEDDTADEEFDAAAPEEEALYEAEDTAMADVGEDATEEPIHADQADYIDTAELTGEMPPAPAAEETAAGKGKSRFLSSLLSRRVVYLPLSATILSAAAAYAITSNPVPQTAKKIAEQALTSGNLRASKDPGARAIGDAYGAVKPEKAADLPLTPAELRKAFRKRLADADLLQRIDLSLQDHQWQIQASLDEEESARFERILTAFMKQHNMKIPVHAKVGGLEAMLPFKIRQVISGANASVVTQDGDRLYVGDEYRGVRLVAVNGNKLSFDGKRKFEVVW